MEQRPIPLLPTRILTVLLMFTALFTTLARAHVYDLLIGTCSIPAAANGVRAAVATSPTCAPNTRLTMLRLCRAGAQDDLYHQRH